MDCVLSGALVYHIRNRITGLQISWDGPPLRRPESPFIAQSSKSPVGKELKVTGPPVVWCLWSAVTVNSPLTDRAHSYPWCRFLTRIVYLVTWLIFTR